LVAFLQRGNPSCGSLGVQRFLFLLLASFVFTLGATPAHAAHVLSPPPASPLENARRAQALLGTDLWSWVIRVENTAARSRYPATVYALVFEEGGLLWFYTDADGTQSLSRQPGRLEEERADFLPLLRAIEPGFAAYEILSDVAQASSPGTEIPRQNHGTGDPRHVALPNGCFIESLAALSESVRRGEPIERARLLNCYVDTPSGRRGHTVLTYETPRGLFLLDPGRSPEARVMPRTWADNAMALAGAALEGSRVVRARWVPTVLPLPPAATASLDSTNDLVSGAAPRLMR
jgi:hypothetical protein